MADGTKRMRIILLSLERQGCVVESKAKGWLVKFPNGGTLTLHKTNSDYRAEMNIRSRILRAGLTWPFDGNHRKA